LITRTPLVEYGSLADLYQLYVDAFLSGGPIEAACGCVIHCYEHHFVHVVKLFDADDFGILVWPTFGS